MADKQDRSIGELLSDLASETGILIRQEIALAKTELRDSAGRAGQNAAKLAVGGALAYAALLVLLAAVVILLADVMPWWAAALVVAVATGIVGGVMVSRALANLKQINLAPRQTIETLREDAEWARQQIK